MSKEIELTSKSFLVSETDKKGIIKFANDDFCEFSGYTLEELLGQAHNMARHPDMPQAIFKDLWESVQSGKTWRGFLKNKSKDGDYYWVYATVYPYTSSDGSESYISCKRRASTDEIKMHDELYLSMS